MHASTASAFKRGATFVVVAGAIGFMTYGSLKLAKIDPFAAYRGDTGDAGRLAFSLTDVTLTHYRIDRTGARMESKLIAKAHVDRLEVLKDRQDMNLIGVHGLYQGEEGKIQFSGRTAKWNSARKRLDVTSGARIVNADFNLKVPRFTFDSYNSHLSVLGAVQGRLNGGDVVAVDFAYNSKSHDFQTGKVDWRGPLALFPQEETPAKREFWHVKGDDMKTLKGSHGNVIQYIHGYAENEDGETIITADIIVHDKKSKIITATGKVFYDSTKANMTCDKAVIYTDDKDGGKEERAVLTGNVNMIVKPKDSQTKAKVEEIPPFRPMVPDAVAEGRPVAPPSGGDDTDPVRKSDNLRKFPMYMLADNIDYWYKKGNRHAVIKGSPQGYQNLPEGRWRRVWTHEAHYDAEAETMELFSSEGKRDTRVRTSMGDDLTATTAEFTTKDEDEDNDMHGKNVEGTVANDTKNQDNGPTKPPPGFERALQIPKVPSSAPKVKKGNGGGLQGPIGGGLLVKAKSQALAIRSMGSISAFFGWPAPKPSANKSRKKMAGKRPVASKTPTHKRLHLG